MTESGKTLQEIRLLNATWKLDVSRPLGPPGGFGEVFEGYSSDGAKVAIKRLKITAAVAAFREMEIGSVFQGRDFENVVPILDSGNDAESDRYYLVMPISDGSLEDYLSEAGGLTLKEAVDILMDILSGLKEVDDIVHRDLKPGNILKHDGAWKIADFGIAKFVRDATSVETLRSMLTPAYAAPEQWIGDRPTTATDIYSLGCIIFRLVGGKPPFETSDLDVLREAHLHRTPPKLEIESDRLVGLVANMLRKSPGSRPSINRVMTVLGGLETSSSSQSRSRLREAGRIVSEEQAALDAQRREEEAREAERRQMVQEADAELRGIIQRLFDAIEADTDLAVRQQNPTQNRARIELGPATLTFEQYTPFSWHQSQSNFSSVNVDWDIRSAANVSLHAKERPPTYNGSSYYVFRANLIFAKLGSDADFRWLEISFHELFTQRSNHDQPFALNPDQGDFATAVSNIMGRNQVAHGPLPIDAEDEAKFQDRWINLFAKAARREHAPPTHLPLQQNFWS